MNNKINVHLLFTALMIFALSCKSKEQKTNKYQIILYSSKFDLIAEKANSVIDTIAITASDDSIGYYKGIELFIEKFCEYATLSKNLPYYNYNLNTKPLYFSVLDSAKRNLKGILKKQSISNLEQQMIKNEKSECNFSFLGAIKYQKDIDSNKEALLNKERAATRIETEAFAETKAGRIHRKHPEWSKEDCKRLAEGSIWIGMSYDMLKYKRGLPNSANGCISKLPLKS